MAVTRTRKVRSPKNKIPKKVKNSGSKQKIVIPSKPNEPPQNFLEYCTVLFGAKGVGKTSLAAQFPGSIVLQLEPRRRNLRIRQYEVRPKSISEVRKSGYQYSPWIEIKEFIEEVLEDNSVKHITIDTADRFYDAAFIHHCAEKRVDNPSKCNDYGQTWDAIRWDVEDTLNKILYSSKGCLITSHAKLRENEEDIEGSEFYAPTCKPAMWTILKAAADYAFFYGYLDSQRVIRLRGNEERYWLACGPEDYFMDKKGNPLTTISAGKSAKEAYQQLTLAFNNEVDSIDISD